MGEAVFGEYGDYYDLFYADKEYAAEAAYLAGLIRERSAGARSLVDSGCGTGRHGRILASLGFDVVGVDQSARMLQKARGTALPAKAGAFEVCEGDVTRIDLARTFDAATALFHVVSYQTTDADLCAFFANVRRHLRPGAPFVFDVWHADAVLAQRPEVRVARRETDAVCVTRIAEPTLDEEARTVEVRYTLFVEDKARGEIRRFEECHCMRYLDAREIESLARGARLEIVRSEEWMTGRPPSVKTWGVCYVAAATDAAR